ncbi:MAG TPA: N-acetyltransferase [Actinomycetota bacterium]|jgi:putative acetyltransferase|nr:N-acetyltransferase [Actinomycetota bacterium]
MRIRAEQAADFDAIHEVVAAAFGRPNEAELVRLLRETDSYVPQLALVAEDDDRIVGHIMLTYAELHGTGADRVLSLAPLAVRPESQRGGVGIALTKAALDAADARDEPLVIVLGHAEYYPRFGFESARNYGIDPPDDAVPDEVFMVVRLRAYDPEIRGRVAYPPAFADTA